LPEIAFVPCRFSHYTGIQGQQRLNKGTRTKNSTSVPIQKGQRRRKKRRRPEEQRRKAQSEGRETQSACPGKGGETKGAAAGKGNQGETAQPPHEGRGQAENHSDPPYPEGSPRNQAKKEQEISNTQETSRETKRLRDGETQEDQDLPSNKKHKPPQESTKAAILEETGREGKEK
jgi:hypothetical protein